MTRGASRGSHASELGPPLETRWRQFVVIVPASAVPDALSFTA